MKKHYSIQLLRFIFCLMIVNYHFYTQFFSVTELPNFFCRAYLGDEFFFMVSGFFIAQAAIRVERDDHGWTINYTAKRIKKIAIPFYFSWALCFLSGRLTAFLKGDAVDFLPKLLNSIYELCFLDMFGFKKGLYSNSVAWYFSALIISMLVICPLIIRFKKNYTLYAAPALGFFMLAILSLNYDYLYGPHSVLPGIPVLKGAVRAFSEINLGVFIYGGGK